MDDNNNTVDQEITKLQELIQTKQDVIYQANKDIQRAALDLRKAQNKKVVISETARKSAAMMTPMDDVFFNKMAEDANAIQEVISTILGMPVIVIEVVPQCTITGIGNRGVRLDSFARVKLAPEVLVKVELGKDCYLGEKGAIVNVEVQKDDNDDAEYRVFYNGASIVVNNTPRGTKKFKDIQRAVVIFISDFDVFGEGEMFYEVHKAIKKSGTPRRSPVAEIYINTVNRDESDDRMKNIADLMELFKDADSYNDEKFHMFSQRKRDLKNTEEGKIEVATEFQKIMDDERKAGIEIGVNDTAGLLNFLWSHGRGDDAMRAGSDKEYMNQLLNDYRSGALVAN